MALFTQNKNIAKIRAILLVIQLFSLLVIGVLWGIGLTIYASKELNNLYNMFEPLVVFGLLGFLWKIKTIVTTALIQITIRVVSIFLSIGITFTSLNLIGITIKLPNIGIIQLNIWIVLTIVSLIFAQSIFISNNIKENQYDIYPTFQVKEERVIFLIPAYNESKSIEKLVNEIKTEYPKSKIVVVDNNSKDNTGKLAEKAGATLIYESKQGKGNAIKTGFNYISQFEYDVALMLDADLTYKTSDALKLINFLASGGYGVILGSRLKGKREKGAITTFNMIGNYFLTIFANF